MCRHKRPGGTEGSNPVPSSSESATNRAIGAVERHFDGLRLETLSFRKPIGSRSKLVVRERFIEQPCLHGPRRDPVRHLAGSSGFSPVILRRLLRHLSAPSDKKCLLPFHLGCPLVLP